jgi:hypothetical protein
LQRAAFSGKSTTLSASESVLDKAELRKLQGFLRETFANQGIKVTQARKNPDDAEVHLGERQIGTIEVDD